MTDLEINKSCFSLITGGKGCWHEFIFGARCVCGWNRPSSAVYREEKIENGHIALNPDYLNNKSDWADLILFVVNEWEGWEEFMLSEGCEPTMVPVCFLKDQRVLPEALARWKEEGG